MKSNHLHVVSGATSNPGPEKPGLRASAKAWAPVVVVCLVIFIASSLPAAALPKTLLFPGQDKVEHGLVYGLLGFLVARARRLRGSRSRALDCVIGAGFSLLYGASDEFHQSFVPGRAVEALDVVADASGGLLGGLLAALASRRAGHGARR